MKTPTQPKQPLDRLHGGPPLIMSPLTETASGARSNFEAPTAAPPVGDPSKFVKGGIEDDDRIAETTTTAVARSRRPRALKGDR
jgi:hypothetical protein